MQIAVDNFRSFAETEFLCSSDLNVFIGKNSSGKSSLLRLFPLLKQTFAHDTNDHFLWYTPDYVDFGDYDNVLGSNKELPISFFFDFQLDPYFLYSSNRMYDHMLSYSSNDISTNNYLKEASKLPSMGVTLRIDVMKDHISNIIMDLKGVTIQVTFDKYKLKSFWVNDFNVYDSSKSVKQKNLRFIPYKRNLLSLIRTSSRNITPTFYNDKVSDDVGMENNGLLLEREFNDLFIKPEILRLWNELSLPNSDFEVIQSYLTKDFLNLNPKHLKNMLIILLEENECYYKGTIESFYKKELNAFVEFFTAYYANDFLLAVDKYLEAYFSKVNYIAPLRAPVQRYYRLQGISLSEIDPSGLNIPMIIANMNDKEMRNFTNWTTNNFGFYVTKSATSGQVSILLGVGEEEPRNIIDLGFGYSQILPIVVSLWQSISKSRFYVASRYNKVEIPYTFVIEQPELHLHPAMQADFIDACINIIQSTRKSNVKFIIETHSEVIINRISESIKKEKLNHDSVTINIVNRKEENHSTVNSVKYDEDGDLLEWPIGFFTTESIKYDYKNR